MAVRDSAVQYVFASVLIYTVMFGLQRETIINRGTIDVNIWLLMIVSFWLHFFAYMTLARIDGDSSFASMMARLAGFAWFVGGIVALGVVLAVLSGNGWIAFFVMYGLAIFLLLAVFPVLAAIVHTFLAALPFPIWVRATFMVVLTAIAVLPLTPIGEEPSLDLDSFASAVEDCTPALLHYDAPFLNVEYEHRIMGFENGLCVIEEHRANNQSTRCEINEETRMVFAEFYRGERMHVMSSGQSAPSPFSYARSEGYCVDTGRCAEPLVEC